MQVEAAEIDAEVLQPELRLAERMAAVEDHVDAAGAGHVGDLAHRRDHPGAVAEVGEQHHAHVGIGLQRRVIGVDQVLFRGRLGQVDLDHAHAAHPTHTLHRGLHGVVVEVGVEDGVALAQAVVAADQGLQAFGGAAREHHLVHAHPEHGRRLGPHLGPAFGEGGPAGVEGGLLVHQARLGLVGQAHGFGHGAELAVLELDHAAGRLVVEGRDLGPVGLVVGPRLGIELEGRDGVGGQGSAARRGEQASRQAEHTATRGTDHAGFPQ